jgi:hypothetical protein
MMKSSRRDFLKMLGLSLGGLAVNLAFDVRQPLFAPYPAEEFISPEKKARITTQSIYLYQEPDFKSPRAGTLKRDYLANILQEMNAVNGPSYNPRWYRVEGGYIHSAYTQRVDNGHLNPVLESIPDGGQLAEVTLPFVDSLRKLRTSWQPLWRLYYSSIHWITHLVEGPDGQPWYGLTDELLHVQYCVPAVALRPIQAQELTPLSPEVPEQEKHVEVSIDDQILYAYEGQQLVREAKISSGLHTKNLPPDVLPTDTPTGYFHIQVKVPSKHMGDGRLTNDILAYELLGVPWVSFFHKDGIGFHGTYWHDNFGRKMSHGCVNLRNEDARWLYRWSLPGAGTRDWNRKGWGTPVQISE